MVCSGVGNGVSRSGQSWSPPDLAVRPVSSRQGSTPQRGHGKSLASVGHARPLFIWGSTVVPVLWRKKPGQGGRDEQQSQDPDQVGPRAAAPTGHPLCLSSQLCWHGTRRPVGLLEGHGPMSWNVWSKFRVKGPSLR